MLIGGVIGVTQPEYNRNSHEHTMSLADGLHREIPADCTKTMFVQKLVPSGEEIMVTICASR